MRLEAISVDDRYEEIFRQYDIKIYNMYRARGAFILETNQGLKLLKSFEGSKHHLEYENRIKLALWNKGYKNIDVYLQNKSNELVTEESMGAKYVIKSWFQGEECNLKDSRDVVRAVRNLAKLHSYLEDCEVTQEEIMHYRQNNFLEVFQKHNRELKRVRGYVRDKRQKNEFEVCFLNVFEEFYDQAEQAIHILNESDYFIVLTASLDRRTVCHGNYTYHNIILLKDGAATTNFEKACVGIQIADLYQFLRKTMEKNDWNQGIGEIILDEYNRNRKISEQEYHLLYVMLLYPEKFWKITNFYYNGKKSWIPQRNIQKLQSIALQNKAKSNFIQHIQNSK